MMGTANPTELGKSRYWILENSDESPQLPELTGTRDLETREMARGAPRVPVKLNIVVQQSDNELEIIMERNTVWYTFVIVICKFTLEGYQDALAAADGDGGDGQFFFKLGDDHGGESHAANA